MRDEVEAALDQCLKWMRAGMPVEACLARYPEYAKDLRPLLEMVPQIGRVLTPPASRAARAEGQKRMLATLERRRQARDRLGPVLYTVRRVLITLFRAPAAAGLRARPVWQSALLSLVLLVVTGSGLALAASSYSLPGEALYPMKLARQELQVALTFDKTSQASLERRFEVQRREEVGLALAAANRGEVHFGGTLEDVQAGIWNISGLMIQLDERTSVVAEPDLGAHVRVRGRLPGDGSLRAIEIEVLGREGDDLPVPGPAESEALASETQEPAPTAEPTEPSELKGATEPPSTPTVVPRPPTATPEPEHAGEVDDDAAQDDTSLASDDDDGDEHEADDDGDRDDDDEPDDDDHEETSATSEADETPDD
ncbi:MAG: hypothetical protein M8467_03470 [Anaerolineae bacterium]|nr:hypothetical protein [Anaerolineae bacterium]